MTIKELNLKISAIDNQIGELKIEKRHLKQDLCKAIQEKFEKDLGVKSGDIVATKYGEKYFYQDFTLDSYGCVVCNCNPIKKDGTPSRAIRHILYWDFNFKVE